MKVIAKTKMPIMLMDPHSNELLEETPAVVTWSHFFESRTGRGQIKVLSEELPAEASKSSRRTPAPAGSDAPSTAPS